MNEISPACLINDAQFVDEDIAKVVLFRIRDPLAKELPDCLRCLHCTGIIAALSFPASAVMPPVACSSGQQTLDSYPEAR